MMRRSLTYKQRKLVALITQLRRLVDKNKAEIFERGGQICVRRAGDFRAYATYPAFRHFPEGPSRDFILEDPGEAAETIMRLVESCGSTNLRGAPARMGALGTDQNASSNGSGMRIG